MMTTSTETLKESFRVLSETLRVDSTPRGLMIIRTVLKYVLDVLGSSRQDPVQQDKVSCILASILEFSVVEACTHYMAQPYKLDHLHLDACSFAEIFLTILQEAPNGKARTKFINLLSNSSYVEITAQTLLSVKGTRVSYGPILAKLAMDRLVDLCRCVCLHHLEAHSIHGNFNSSAYALRESYKNFLVSVFCYFKLLLYFELTRVRLQVPPAAGNCPASPSRTSHQSSEPGHGPCTQLNACAGLATQRLYTSTAAGNCPPSPRHTCHSSSESLNARISEQQMSGTREAAIQQHLLQLHRHLLQAVKLLEPAFELVTDWQTAREFLLEEDLLSTDIHEDTVPEFLDAETSKTMWSCIANVTMLLFQLLSLQSTPDPLEEVVTNMAVELLLVLGCASFVPPLPSMRILGEQLWKKIQKDPDDLNGVHLTVRIIFAFQLSLEAMSSKCKSNADSQCSTARAVSSSTTASVVDCGKSVEASAAEHSTSRLSSGVNVSVNEDVKIVIGREVESTRKDGECSTARVSSTVTASIVKDRRSTEASGAPTSSLSSPMTASANEDTKNTRAEDIELKREMESTALLMYGTWIHAFENHLDNRSVTSENIRAILRTLHEEAFEALLERQIRWLSSQEAQCMKTVCRIECVKHVMTLISKMVQKFCPICVGCQLSLCATLTKFSQACIDEFRRISSCELKRQSSHNIQRIFDAVGLYTMLLSLPQCFQMEGTSDTPHLHPTLEVSTTAVRYVYPVHMSPAECASLIQYSLVGSIQILENIVDAGDAIDYVLLYVLDLPSCLLHFLHRINQLVEHNAKAWFVQALLNCSFIPLLNQSLLNSPELMSTSENRAIEMNGIFFILSTLSIATSSAPRTIVLPLARQMLEQTLSHTHLLGCILVRLKNTEQEVAIVLRTSAQSSKARRVEYRGHTVEVLRAPKVVQWGVWWVIFFKVLLQVQVAVFGEVLSPLEDLTRDAFHVCLEELPGLKFSDTEGFKPWVVLRTRDRRQSKKSPTGESGNTLYWLAKQSEFGTIGKDSYGIRFAPSASLAESILGCTERAIAGCVDDTCVQPDGILHFSQFNVPLLRVGCWSRKCRNLSGRSEASLRTRMCARCRTARYCCRGCQMADWTWHKGDCKPWEDADVA